MHFTLRMCFDHCASVIENIKFTIYLTAESGQPNATLDWTRPDLAAHLDMYSLTADFYQGSTFPIGVTKLTRVATGPCGRNITYMYEVIVTGKYLMSRLRKKTRTAEFV